MLLNETQPCKPIIQKTNKGNLIHFISPFQSSFVSYRDIQTSPHSQFPASYPIRISFQTPREIFQTSPRIQNNSASPKSRKKNHPLCRSLTPAIGITTAMAATCQRGRRCWCWSAVGRWQVVSSLGGGQGRAHKQVRGRRCAFRGRIGGGGVWLI